MPVLAINARRVMERCDALARHSEDPGKLTRVFLSAQHRACAQAVIGWMHDAGMQARMDAIGNVLGRYEGTQSGLPSLLLGSHLDTVRDAGRYDGMLGVITAIECVQACSDAGKRFPFAIEIAGFGDEEGARFGSTLLGSRALAGSFDPAALTARDREGTTLAQALRDFGLDPGKIGDAARKKAELLAYVELHIEQGPVLESLGLPVGVVTAINGFSRLRAALAGSAGHAGTVPMALRRDALAAAAECVLAVERIANATPDLVATVGRIDALPGAINVIPGDVSFTLDIRAPDNAVRNNAVRDISADIHGIASRRKLAASIETLQQQNAAACAGWLVAQFEQAIRAEGHRLHRLPSGAGHDGMAMQAIADIAMLFVRCKEGISHHPAESITEADAGAAAQVLARFIENFGVPNP
ncbi:MAG: Zn-dependent hydrolase [Betaproteobacteria bacterium RIFCSPLOWO2_02_FULL_62_17]|nr:MAG: Zn-dependent hydrolase [Betaproteobacteria bacterium RIFCSPLOWO2_02_FULL_62_17]